MGIMDLFKKKTSGNVAKDRLKLVLVSDRANCSSEMMEMMKNDIIEVISRYMDIDAEALDVKITETESDSNNGTVPALVANIPIRDMKHRRAEIEITEYIRKCPAGSYLPGVFTTGVYMIRTMFRSESRRRTSALAPGARVPMVCSNPILFAGL